VKRTPLKRSDKPMRRSAMMKRQVKSRRSSLVEFSTFVREGAMRRGGFQCESQGVGCRKTVAHYHHRHLRSHGGTGALENCLALCGPCHAQIHANPGWAYRHGLMVRAFANPGDVEVFPGCDLKCEEDHAGQ